jgi:hypothetical protein
MTMTSSGQQLHTKLCQEEKTGALKALEAAVAHFTVPKDYISHFLIVLVAYE